MHNFSTTKVLILLQTLLTLGSSVPSFAGELSGVVVDKHSRDPINGAMVTIISHAVYSTTERDGRFSIPAVPVGQYTIEATAIGYKTRQVEKLMISEVGSLEVTVELEKAPIALAEIIVTPGRFTLMRKTPTIQQTLKRDDLRSVPQLGEDVYRAVARLPGLATDDYSAQFTVRGGRNDEVLVLLDGLELYEPFHLKDINGGALSIIDVETIGGLDMMTGAFPAAYGNRLSGVFDMKSARPSFTDRRRTSLAISVMNARFLSEGYFNNQRGHWLFVARRGYLDLVLGLTGASDETELSPVYYDVSGKLAYDLNEKHTVSASVLWADDDLDVVEDEDIAKTGYGNGYAWLTWRANFHSKLFTQTVLSAGRVTKDRRGTDLSSRDGRLIYEVAEERAFNLFGVKQDWTVDLSEKHLLTAGFDAKRLEANYDYFNRNRIATRIVAGQIVEEFDSTTADRHLSGNRLGVHLGDRVRLSDPLTAEIGLRYDYFSWTDDNHVSPRANVAYALRTRTVLRAGWGQFYQSQGIHELNVQDGDEEFYPAELAEHRTVGVENVFDNEINLRVEAYQKVLSDIHPRYQSLFGDVEFFPEVESDRIRLEPDRGESKGIEVFLKRDASDKLSWWASYAYAIAEDEIDGRKVPRNFDQRHTVYLDLNYRPNAKWRLNIAWQYHTGWPYTALNFKRTALPDESINISESFGPVNVERFPAYHRLDLRVHRYFTIGDGRLSLFVEVRNLYNRFNVRLYEYNLHVLPTGELKVMRQPDNWLPILPSIGISWDF